jgi:hypothetical protein
MLGTASSLTPFNHLTGRPPPLHQGCVTGAGPLPHLEREVKMKHPVKIVVMNSFNHSYSSIFVASLQRLKIPAELVVIPYFMPNELSPVRVRSVQELLNPTWPGQQVIYCPGVMELFLSGAHHSLHFSGYRDWHNPEDVTVLPHPWSIHANRERAKLEWDVKPALSASFMGSFEGALSQARSDYVVCFCHRPSNAFHACVSARRKPRCANGTVGRSTGFLS